MKILGHIFFALFFFAAGVYFHHDTCRVVGQVLKAVK